MLYHRWMKGTDMTMLNELETRITTLESRIKVLEAKTAKRPRGRPMAATEDQARAILALHADGLSLRAVANETGLSIRAVRTVIDKARGVHRT